MKKKILSVVLLCAMIGTLSGCSGSKTETTAVSSAQESPVSSVAEVSSEVSTTPAQTAAVPTTAVQSQDAATGNTVRGIVIDATMNNLLIQSEYGTTLSFIIGGEAPKEIDTSGLAEGLLIGHPVKVSYDGEIQDDNTELAVVTAIADTTSKCSDYDALAAAGSVLYSVRLKDMNGLAGMCAYPVYVGINEGRTINSQKEFESSFTTGSIFTENLINSVINTNLLDLEISNAGLVLSSTGGTPDIIISQTDDGWLVTGINY